MQSASFFSVLGSQVQSSLFKCRLPFGGCPLQDCFMASVFSSCHRVFFFLCPPSFLLFPFLSSVTPGAPLCSCRFDQGPQDLPSMSFMRTFFCPPIPPFFSFSTCAIFKTPCGWISYLFPLKTLLPEIGGLKVF